ncbi:NnrS family protein [Simiduia curdlanivorans]|uniref:NnrS family protein n=1 Tax=Simiduia curdlanivorans TaxID=1492769 RepID=A0ABV8V5H5_9GAMM|nr:NnrS family protein [Simiduia curdlanivorans]MDN3640630.1 NnrS family protein [Simiduia curdlanivorans]
MSQLISKTPALLGLAFRPFFLFGGVFSAIAVALWIASLNGWLSFNPYGGSYFWHAHEMVFGFVCAIVTGFLLTAVQNWTGIPGIKGRALLLLLALWLGARLALAIKAPTIISATLDLLFLPAVIYCLAKPVITIKQYRNLLFVPILLLMFVGNLVSHIALWRGDFVTALQGIYGAAWLVVMIMTILGGRIVPMFTANGSQTTKVNNIPALEIATLASTLFVVLCQASGVAKLIPASVNFFVCALVAGIQFWRVLRWRFWVTTKVPLLWSLHISFLFMPLMLLLLSIHYFTLAWPSLSVMPIVTYSTAMHLLFVGAMANMILAMMARVALGHSGRPLIPAPIMSLAFIAIALAALTRTVLMWLLPSASYWLLNTTAFLWILAYGIFAIIYWPVLTRPRLDGKPG